MICDNRQLQQKLLALNRANSAMMGISLVLKEMQDATYTENDWPLKGNDFVANCLLNGLDALATYVDLTLESLSNPSSTIN